MKKFFEFLLSQSDVLSFALLLAMGAHCRQLISSHQSIPAGCMMYLLINLVALFVLVLPNAKRP